MVSFANRSFFIFQFMGFFLVLFTSPCLCLNLEVMFVFSSSTFRISTLFDPFLIDFCAGEEIWIWCRYLTCGYPSFPHHLWKRPLFFQYVFLTPCQRLGGYNLDGFILGSYILFHWSMYLVYTSSHWIFLNAHFFSCFCNMIHLFA